MTCPALRAEGDFLSFARAMLASRDEDPFYPVLTWLIQSLDREQALWLSFLFVAYCHLGSAWHAWITCPTPHPLPPQALRWPFYTDRRGLRGGRLAEHVASYCALLHETHGAQEAWITQGWTQDPLDNYERFWVQCQRIWGNGRWAAFKWAEILKKVLGLPLAAPDMRLRYCTGPKAGLAWLYGMSPHGQLPGYLSVSTDVLSRLHKHGLMVDWESAETLLCNWHSLVCGRYYVGCDIDAQQEEIGATELPPREQERLFEARHAVLPGAYLGEQRGWAGVQSNRLPVYKHRGLILVRS